MGPSHVTSYSRAARHNSFSLFLLALPMLVVARLTLLVRPRDAGLYAQVDAMAIFQIAIVALAFFAILVAPNVRGLMREISRGSLGGLVAYYVVCVLSSLWSVAPSYTLYRAMEMIILPLAVYVACSYIRDPIRLERRILLAASLIVVLGVAKHIKLSGLSIESLHTNSYSAVAGMIFVYCAAEYLSSNRSEGRRRSYLRNFGIFGAVFVVVGTSAASNISVVAGMVLLGMLSRNVLLIFVSLFLAAIGALLMSTSDFIDLLFPGKSISQITSGTGRIRLWELYLSEFYRSPLLGNGFAVTTRTLSLYTTNTHNGYFAVLLGTGIVGGIVFASFLWRMGHEAMKLSKRRGGKIHGASIALFVAMINNLSVSIVGEQWGIATMGFVLFLALHMRSVSITRAESIRKKRFV